jgi:hypothetical protein
MAGLEDVAGVLGVSVPVVRFLFCFLASIPCSWLARFTPAGALRNLYAAGSGALLSYYAFGAAANFLFFFPILVSYGSMLVYRRRCGVITFFIAFAFLIAWSELLAVIVCLVFPYTNYLLEIFSIKICKQTRILCCFAQLCCNQKACILAQN